MKRTAVLRHGALLYFAKQNDGGQNPIHSYINCASVNDLVMLLCCTKLTYWIYLGISHGVTINMIPNCMASCYGQISIETATYSLAPSLRGVTGNSLNLMFGTFDQHCTIHNIYWWGHCILVVRYHSCVIFDRSHIKPWCILFPPPPPKKKKILVPQGYWPCPQNKDNFRKRVFLLGRVYLDNTIFEKLVFLV